MKPPKFVKFPVHEEPCPIGYIDAMPGSGKTELFVSEVGFDVSRNTTRTQLHIYAAPTVQLLVETYNRLILNAKKRKRTGYAALIRRQSLLVTHAHTDALNDLLPEANYSVESPVAAIQYATGVDSFDTYVDRKLPKGTKLGMRNEFYLNGSQPDSRISQNAVHPAYLRVLFVTHEALLRVRKELPCRKEKKNYLIRTQLWFDEARQCFAKGLELSVDDLTPKDVQLMYSCVDIGDDASPIDDTEVLVEGKSHEVGFFPITGMLTMPAVLKQFECSTVQDLPPAARRFFDMLRANCSAGRSSVFVRLPFKQDDSTGKKRPIITHEVETFVATRPENLFSGYGAVILMSAMFKDSQMYNILRESKKHVLYNLNELLTNENPHKYRHYILSGYMDRPRILTTLANLYKRHRRQHELITDRIRYVALAESGTLLSKHFLNTSVLLPRELEERVTYAAANLPKAQRVPRRTLIEGLIAGKDVLQDPELSRKCKMFMVPPLWVAMRKAEKILKEAGCEKALLFVNSIEGPALGRTWLDCLDYIDALRNPQKFLTQDTSHLSKFDLAARNIGGHLTRWFEWLEKVVHTEKFFTVPRTTAVRGLNVYKDHVAYVHLAALNQMPVMYEFCKAVVPRYDVDLDNVIDNILQTLYRTNLRDPKSDKLVYMILHSEEAVRKLEQKVKGKLRPLNEGRAPMAQLSYQGEVNLTEEGREGRREGGRKGGVKGGLKRRKYFPEDAKAIAKMQMLIAVSRKRGHDLKLAKLETELADFKAKSMRAYAESTVIKDAAQSRQEKN